MNDRIEDNTVQLTITINIDDRLVSWVRRARTRRVAMAGLMILGLGMVLPADAVTVPNTFVPNTTIFAAEVNANFGALDTAVDSLEAAQWGATGSDRHITTGSVGIGTTTPGAALHVVSGSTAADGISMGNAALTEGMTMWHDQGSARSFIDDMFDGASSKLTLRMRTLGTPVEALTILGNGNVGVGTTSPANALHVVGSLRISNLVLTEQGGPSCAGGLTTLGCHNNFCLCLGGSTP